MVNCRGCKRGFGPLFGRFAMEDCLKDLSKILRKLEKAVGISWLDPRYEREMAMSREAVDTKILEWQLQKLLAGSSHLQATSHLKDVANLYKSMDFW